MIIVVVGVIVVVVHIVCVLVHGVHVLLVFSSRLWMAIVLQAVIAMSGIVVIVVATTNGIESSPFYCRCPLRFR